MPQSNTQEFINQSLKVHGGKYDYSGTVYLDSRVDVLITCPAHGHFLQRPTRHLAGCGCTECFLERKSNDTRRKFIKKAKEVHGERYSYDVPDRMKVRDKISILCSTHGIFKQRSDHHVKGAGCPSCGKYGFDQKASGYLYFLKSQDGKFCKIGVTGKIEQRLGQLKKSTPFTFEVAQVLPMNGDCAWSLEKHIKQTGQSAGFSDFSGASEWLTHPEGVERKLNVLCKGVPRALL